MDIQFYNVSDFTWKKLLDDSENIKSNFEAYLNGFLVLCQEKVQIKFG